MRTGLLLGAVAATCVATTASAATLSEAVAGVGVAACQGMTDSSQSRRIEPGDLAAAVLASVAIRLLDLAPTPAGRTALVRKLAIDGSPLIDDDPVVVRLAQETGLKREVVRVRLERYQEQLQPIVALLANSLERGSVGGLSAALPGGGSIVGSGSLFGSSESVVLTCASDESPPAGGSPSRLAIRGSIQELTLLGDARMSAGAFSLGFERNHTKANGIKTRTSTFTASGAVGYVINRSSINPLMVFADYSRRRVRTRSDSATSGSEDQGSDDVNAIELGLTGARFIPGVGAGSLVLSGQTGVIFDRRASSNRLSGGLVVSPRLDAQLPGVCGVYGPAEVRIGPVRFGASCRPAFVAEVAHVLRKGTASFGAGDDLLATGAEFRYAITPLSTEKSGPVGGVLLSYLPVVAGRAPDLSVLEAELGYRWWDGDGLGLDLKLSYRDGVERKSLAQENVLAVRLGLIF